jgi:biotin carboxyl carrier protein
VTTVKKHVHLHDGEREWTVSIGEDHIEVGGLDGTFDVEPLGDGRFRLTEGAEARRAAAARSGSTVWVTIGGEVFEFHLGGLDEATGAAVQDADLLSPPMSATVVRVAVAEGDAVEAGALLVALEAMKMELPIRAPRDGTITAIHCAEGDLVQPGQALVEMD